MNMSAEEGKPVEPVEHVESAEVVENGATAGHAHASKSSSRKLLRAFALGLACAIVVGAVGAIGATYAMEPSSAFVRAVSKVVPLPAAVVDGKVVYVRDVLSERDALVKYYGIQGKEAPPEHELTSQILDTLVNKQALQNLADRAGVTADPEGLKAAEAQIVEQAGGEEKVDEQLMTSFGWTRDEFRARVLRSVALAEAMQKYVAGNAELQTAAKAKVDGAKARLDAGEEFAKVSTELSEDASGEAGGDVGSIPASQIPEAAKTALDALKVGGVTGVIETDGAYVILKLNGLVKAKKDKEAEYKLSTIVVEKMTLEGVVNEYITTTKVTRFIDRS